MNNDIPTLPQGAILQGTNCSYRVERVLGSGTFGITYLASMIMSGNLGTLNVNINVAIKEFFMNDINGREGTSVTTGSQNGIFGNYRRKFAREAQNLAKFKHHNIINVMDFFEVNNTSYYVMEYIDGGCLDDLIHESGPMKECDALTMLHHIGNALSYMHSQCMLHLDLKPRNIMLRNDLTPILIDFGLSKQYDANGDPESSTSVGGGTPGYAPIEQADYHDGKEFPVTMDIYALGATFFKMLTGHVPPTASAIVSDGFPSEILLQHNVSANTVAVIEKAMSPSKRNRYQSVDEMLQMLGLDSEKTSFCNDTDTHHETSQDKNTVSDEKTEFEQNVSNGCDKETSDTSIPTSNKFSVFQKAFLWLVNLACSFILFFTLISLFDNTKFYHDNNYYAGFHFSDWVMSMIQTLLGNPQFYFLTFATFGSVIYCNSIILLRKRNKFFLLLFLLSLTALFSIFIEGYILCYSPFGAFRTYTTVIIFALFIYFCSLNAFPQKGSIWKQIEPANRSAKIIGLTASVIVILVYIYALATYQGY